MWEAHSIQTGADDFCARAEALIALKRYAEALALLQRATAADPAAAQPHCLMAQALIELCRFGEALKAAESATRLAPELEWPHRLRSISLSALGRERESLQAAREAVRISPDGAYGLHQLALRLWMNWRRREARETAARLLRVAPEDAATYELLAWMAVDQWQLKEGERLARQALQLDPERAGAFSYLSRALRWQRRGREAIDAGFEAVRLSPMNRVYRQELVQSVQAYVVSGWAAIGVLFLLIFELIDHFQTPAFNRELQLIVLLALVLLTGLGLYAWHEVRLRTLPPEVVDFYRQETRRSLTHPAR